MICMSLRFTVGFVFTVLSLASWVWSCQANVMHVLHHSDSWGKRYFGCIYWIFILLLCYSISCHYWITLLLFGFSYSMAARIVALPSVRIVFHSRMQFQSTTMRSIKSAVTAMRSSWGQHCCSLLFSHKLYWYFSLWNLPFLVSSGREQLQILPSIPHQKLIRSKMSHEKSCTEGDILHIWHAQIVLYMCLI